MSDSIRYSRQTAALGPDSQSRLAASSALILGAGGLGVPAATYLAASGLGRMIINDFDTVDESNLPRQIIYSTDDIGAPKATIAAQYLNQRYPDSQITALTERLDRDTLTGFAADVDAVLDCTDNFNSRWLVNEACAATGTALVSGAAIRLEGQLSVFRHDQAGAPCYRCLYSEADENLHDCAGQGILGPVAGTIGTMMATETIRYLLGEPGGLDGRLFVYDARSSQSRIIDIRRQADCPVCAAKNDKQED